MPQIAKVGDSVEGIAHWQGRNREREWVDNSWKDEDGDWHDDGYWREYWGDWQSNTSIATGKIENGSSNILINGNSVAYVGSTATLSWTMEGYHDYYPSNTSTVAAIADGKETILVNGKKAAYIGCSLSASGCTGIKITGGSSNVFTG